METFTYIEKDGWGSGPWLDEYDKATWTDEETGLLCQIVRVPHSGHLCGYVAIGPENPLYGVEYGDEAPCLTRLREDRLEKPLRDEDAGLGVMINLMSGDDWPCTPESVFEIHGGITYARKNSDEADRGESIGFVNEGGDPMDVWIFGFDCGHSGDISPVYGREFEVYGYVYRSFSYVKDQTERLARQIAAVAAEPA